MMENRVPYQEEEGSGGLGGELAFGTDMLDEFFKKSQKYYNYDLRLSLFASALYSIRSTTVLKPYPCDYYDQELQEIKRDALINVFQRVPGFTVTNNNPKMCQETAKLVRWILTYGQVNLQCKRIDEIEREAGDFLQANIYEQRHALKLLPNYIFEVTYPDNRARSRTFAKFKSEHGSFHAFHGSPMENFHSILHHGLAQSLNKRALFGQGTYLSSKLEVAFNFSPFAQNYYQGSMLGKKLSCVALCEVINHPDVEQRKKRPDIPNTYYVVTNNELIRVVYLLIYTPERISNEPRHFSNSLDSSSSSSSSLSPNLVLLSLIVIFVAIGYYMTHK